MRTIRNSATHRGGIRRGEGVFSGWLPEPGALIHMFSWTTFVLVISYIYHQWSLDGWEGVSPLAIILAVPYVPFVLFLCTGLVVHELGHAAAAWMVGMRVFEIAIGTFGKTLFRRRVGGVALEVKQHPLDGFVLASHKSLRFLRLRDTVMTLGGPVANGIVCAVALLVQHRTQLSYWSIEGFVVTFVGVTNGLRALYSLYPREMTMGFGELPSDGLSLIKTPSLSLEQRKALHADYFLREGLAAREQGDAASCLDWLERGLAEYPEDVPLKAWFGVTCLETNRFHRAHATFQQLLARDDLEENEKLQGCIYLVWTNLATGDPKLLAEAEAASQTAMQIAPDDLAARYARGSLLVQVDRVDEGLQLLQAAVAEDSVSVHQAVGASFIAMGLVKANKLPEARDQLEIARQLDPHCVFLLTAERYVFSAETEAAETPDQLPLELSAT